MTETISLKEQVKQHTFQISVLENEIARLKELVCKNINKMDTDCDHSWIRDKTCIEPCGITPLVCKKCDSSKY